MKTTINEAIEKHVEYICSLSGYCQSLHPNDFKHCFKEIATLAATEERELCARIVERNCTECDTCRVKPGSPILCQGCLDNRDSITAAIRARGQGNDKTV